MSTLPDRSVPVFAGLTLLAALLAAEAPRALADDVEPAPAGAAEEGAEADEAPRVHVVARGPLVLDVEREGRVEAAARAKVRVHVRGYGGSLEVAEVLEREGPVEKGEPLVRLDAPELEEELRAGREELARARLDHDLARAERKLAEEQGRVSLKKAELAKEDAEREWTVFERWRGANMLKEADLSLRDRENGLEDQKEELAQLEKMYQGTSLAGETKDIVMERARRAVASAQEWLGIARDERTIVRELEQPARRRQLREQLRDATDELAHAREEVRIADARGRAELEQKAIAVRDAEEKLARLEADRERLVIRAPEAGWLAPLEVEPGDAIDAKAVIGEVHRPQPYVVRISAAGQDLRVLRSGERVAVFLPEMPEIDLAGVVREVGGIGGEGEGGGTTFRVIIALERSDDSLRPGLAARVVAARTIPDAIAVPLASVSRKDGRCVVWVKAAGGPERRTVRLGAFDADEVQVLAGLEPGEEVLLDAPAEAGAKASVKESEPPAKGAKAEGKGEAGAGKSDGKPADESGKDGEPGF